MKKYFKNNTKQLIIIGVIIVFAIIFTCVWANFMNWVSIMISVPSFLMSFIVLNKFNVESDLNLALKTARGRELVEQGNKRRFSECYDKNFNEVKNSLNDIEKYYNIQIKDKSDNQISQVIVGNAKKGLEKYKEFVFETKDYVDQELTSQESAELIIDHHNPYNMNRQDITILIKNKVKMLGFKTDAEIVSQATLVEQIIPLISDKIQEDNRLLIDGYVPIENNKLFLRKYLLTYDVDSASDIVINFLNNWIQVLKNNNLYQNVFEKTVGFMLAFKIFNFLCNRQLHPDIDFNKVNQDLTDLNFKKINLTEIGSSKSGVNKAYKILINEE